MDVTFTKVKLPYGWLGNMAPFPITYQDHTYRTTEALYQAMKFEQYPEIQKLIRDAKSPMAAKMIAKSHAAMVTTSQEQNIENMKLCLRLKLEQHPTLRGLS